MLKGSPRQISLSRENAGPPAPAQHKPSPDIQPDVPVPEHPAQARPCRRLGRAEVWSVCRVASGVDETVFSRARYGRDSLGLDHREIGGGEPSFPLVRELWPVLDGAEDTAADHAAAFLDSVEPLAGVVDRQGDLASSPCPVLGKRGVVG